MEKVVFLDRDGTINIDYGYVTDPTRLDLLPGSASAIGMLKRAGYKVVVVTNQSAVGRKMAEEKDVHATNEAMQQKLQAEDRDAVCDYILICPHGPEDNCNCRKPLTGLLASLPPDFVIDVKNSWIVGDKKSDLYFGMNLGIPEEQRILVLTGEGEKQRLKLQSEKGINPRCANDLLNAAKEIISK